MPTANKTVKRVRTVSKRKIPPVRKRGKTLVDKAPPTVRRELSSTIDLPAFRDTSLQLSIQDRLRTVEQALVLIGQNYAHLPLKEAIHAVDPVQRLRLLQHQLSYTPEQDLPDELAFHREMSTIFLSFRDLHTNYILPDPFKRMTAFIPFMIEEYFDDGARRYLVTRVFAGFSEPPFDAGVEVLSWNGIPIQRAVDVNGDRFAGSNQAARHARGIETLTVRALATALPPDEDRVIVEYRTSDSKVHELRVGWMVFSPDATGLAGLAEIPREIAVAQGVDVELEMVRRAKKVLFAPQVVEAEKRMLRRGAADIRKLGLTSRMPNVIEARSVDTEFGEYAYVRIRTFSVERADDFLQEFIRLTEQLPKTGLMIDVRGNGGGLIPAGERLLQLLTPHRIQPSLFQFINTSLNLELCEGNGFLNEWVDSLRRSVLTGSQYSSGFPITSPEEANNRGQRYHGPVVLITDALCYSTTDIFAAGFQDHDIGPILGVDGNTGAGGANVWTHDLLSDLFPADGRSPYRPLPGNTSMRVSIRRTMRVGASSGTPLEDLGVQPDHRHEMTRDDLLAENVDLIATAGELLAGLPVRELTVGEISASTEGLQVDMTTVGIDRLDIYADGHPVGSVEVTTNDTRLSIPVDDPSALEFRGYDDGELVVSRRLSSG
jgi:C-terminal processing protease CtpA/Prc